MKTIDLETLKKVYAGEVQLDVENVVKRKVKNGYVTEIKTIKYYVEEIQKHLVYVMGMGWGLKKSLDDYNAISLKEYFDKELFKTEQREKEQIRAVEKELRTMSNSELLKVCGGDIVLNKLNNNKLSLKEAKGDYKYKGITVMKIDDSEHSSTFTLYFAGSDGRDKIINNNLDFFIKLVNHEKINREYGIEK